MPIDTNTSQNSKGVSNTQTILPWLLNLKYEYYCRFNLYIFRISCLCAQLILMWKYVYNTDLDFLLILFVLNLLNICWHVALKQINGYD